MSEDETQTEGMKALEQSLNDHMEICRLQRKAKRLKVENARLKAEVENSNRINTELLLLSNQQASEVRRLKAEVERLRKAGDAMVPLLGRGDYHDARINWNAAKEGKQP